MLKDELDRKNREANVEWPLTGEEESTQKEANLVWNSIQRLIKELWIPGVTLEIEAGCYNGGVFWQANYYNHEEYVGGKYNNELIMYTRKTEIRRWLYKKGYQIDYLLQSTNETLEAVMKIARENGIEASKSWVTEKFNVCHNGVPCEVETGDFCRFMYYPTEE